MNAQAGASIKKKRWYNIEEEDDDNDDDNDDELVEVQQLHSLKGRGIRIGSMDKFVTKKKRQVIMNCMFKKENMI